MTPADGAGDGGGGDGAAEVGVGVGGLVESDRMVRAPAPVRDVADRNIGDMRVAGMDRWLGREECVIGVGLNRNRRRGASDGW